MGDSLLKQSGFVNLQRREKPEPKARTGWISLGLLKLAIDPGDKLFIVTGAGHGFRA
jgi:hypothetical protein